MDKKIQSKRLIKRSHIQYISISVLVIAIGLYISIRDTSAKLNIEKEKVIISEVFNGKFHDFIRIMGQVEPISTVFLDVEEGGKIEEIYIEEGAMVNRGDVILKLRNNDLNLTIMNSESNLAYHTNELRNTMIAMEQGKIINKQQILHKDFEILRLKRHYETKKMLYEKKVISKEEFIVSQEEYTLAVKDRELIYMKLVQDSIFRENQRTHMDQNLNNMQINLSMVRQRLDNLNVKAPVDGQLGSLTADIGQSISKGQRIGQINVLTSFKIKAKINEHYIDRIKKGLISNLERKQDSFNLKIAKVYPDVREGQFDIDLIFTGKKPENMRTGQTYYMNLQLGETTESLQVARGGFFQSTGGQWAFVLSEDGSYAEKRMITIGKQNPKYYQILDGLKPGEKIISSGYDMFGDSEKIILQ
ncbi:MAG: HlyD family efflux transporter periplasmic adaptor subunit [Bacteroidales bacterium]|nr:HlyD family efflux transporter periplasmic adaptor subunit [Bacteroidales bacterium]